MFRSTDLRTRALCVAIACACGALVIACNDAPESPAFEVGVDPSTPPAENPEHSDEACAPNCDNTQCIPVCAVAQCAQDDGCGAACGPCPAVQSCEDCRLKLSVVETLETPPGSGVVREVVVALDYQPSEFDPNPALADLRFAVTGGELVSVALSPTVLDAGKELHVDPETGPAVPDAGGRDRSAARLLHDEHQSHSGRALAVLEAARAVRRRRLRARGRLARRARGDLRAPRRGSDAFRRRPRRPRLRLAPCVRSEGGGQRCPVASYSPRPC